MSSDHSVFRHTHVDGALTADERAQAEYERDLLVELVARAAMRRADSPFYDDERFIEWVGREMRTRRAFDRSADEDDEAVSRELWERLAIRWVAPSGPRPVARRAIVSSPGAAAVEEAARHGCAPQWDLAVAAGSGRALWDEPCTEWIELPPGTPAGRHVALRVAGDSMTPAIHGGDVILVRLGGELKRGAIVVVRGTDDGYVVKRLDRLDRRRVVLGSFNPAFSPIVVPRDPARVLGTVIMRWCEHLSPH
jgi:hypothetical protein